MVQAKGIRVFYFIYLYILVFNLLLIKTADCVGFQLGANAILAVSLAVCKAGAAVKNIPLYKVLCCCHYLNV